jgi:hypothetical protein
MRALLSNIEWLVVLLLVTFFVTIQGPGSNTGTPWNHALFFAYNNYDYTALKQRYPLRRAAMEAWQVVPEGHTLSHSPVGNRWDLKTLSYEVYPELRIAEEGDYHLDLYGTFEAPEPGWTERKLSAGRKIYARPGKVFLDTPRALHDYPKKKALLVLLGLTAWTAIAGSFLLALLAGKRTEHLGVLSFLSFSYLSGLLAFHVPLILLSVIGRMPLNRWSILGTWIALSIALGFRARKHLIRQLRLVCSWRRWMHYVPLSASGFILLTAMLYVMAVLVSRTVFHPPEAFDALWHWLVKAKFIYAEGHPKYSFIPVPEYPPLWPLINGVNYLLLGGVADYTALWLIAGFLCLTACILVDLAIIAGLAKRLIYLAPFLVLWVFHNNIQNTAYGEAPLLAFFTAFFFLSMLLLRKMNRLFPLWVLFALGAALCKLEGTAAVLIATLALGLARGVRSIRWRSLSMSAIGILVVAVFVALQWAWGQWITSGPTEELGVQSWHFTGSFGRDHVGLLLDLLNRILQDANPVKIGFFGLLFGLFLGAGTLRRNRDASRFLFYLGIGLLLFPLIAVANWDADHIQKVAIKVVPRVFLLSVPPLVFLLFQYLPNSSAYPSTARLRPWRFRRNMRR